MNHATATQLSGAPQLVIDRASPEDYSYVLDSWLQCYQQSARWRKVPFELYRPHVRPQLTAILADPETQVIAAYLGAAVVGWLAFEQRRSVDIVHWVHTRYRIGHDGPELRKHGIMRSLFSAAPLRDRIAYTHRGPLPKQAPRIAADVWIAAWLMRRGMKSVSFAKKEEWK